jgi:hypothetical protein
LRVDLLVINSHSTAAVAKLAISTDRSAFIWPVLVAVRNRLKNIKPLFVSAWSHHSYPYMINTIVIILMLTTNIDRVNGLSALFVLNL